MDIAALCHTYSLTTGSLATLGERGIRVHPHKEFAALAVTLRARRFDAVLVEEDIKHLSYWLAVMRTHIGSRVPVVVLGSGHTDGIVVALQHGADDYASIGDGMDAAIQRAQARVQRLCGNECATPLQVGDFVLDPEARLLSNARREVVLTAREFALAWALFENHGRLVSVNQLSTRVWGCSGDIAKRTIEQHVYKLRRKLAEVTGARHTASACIKTSYGVGYRLQLQLEPQDRAPAVRQSELALWH